MLSVVRNRYILPSVTSLLLACMMLTAVRATASPKRAIFSGSLDEVFAAALKAANENWEVSFTDPKTYVIEFNTGISLASNGMACSALLARLPDGKVEISLSVRKKMQAFAWGAGDRISSKYFLSIKQILEREHKASLR
ncbi:MAG: hypothetical protein ABR880_21950 [Candidatus Sulfotelmatobacter sp.]